MSQAGMHGMAAAGEDMLAIAASLTSSQWQEHSAATGWSIKDVYIHVGSLLEMLQAVVDGTEPPALGVEQLNDQVVALRRDWTPAETTDFLRQQLDSAIPLFTALQDEPTASMTAQMLDLGTYPLHAIADMFSFDITTHLRYDVLAPRGPLALPVPDLDDVRMAPAVSWLVAGLSQMQPDLASHVTAPIGLHLTGPGGRDLLLDASSGSLAVTVADGGTAAAATITSTTSDFLAWSTTRVPWSSVVHIDGDVGVATAFLNTLNLV